MCVRERERVCGCVCVRVGGYICAWGVGSSRDRRVVEEVSGWRVVGGGYWVVGCGCWVLGGGISVGNGIGDGMGACGRGRLCCVGVGVETEWALRVEGCG